VTITLTGGNAPEPRPPSVAVTLDGEAAVLAAARQAERQPTGRYWHVDRIEGRAFIMRPETGTYAITAGYRQSFRWWGAEPGMGEAFYVRALPARPQTGRDEELWRRAGSPSSFRVGDGDERRTYTTKASRWRPVGRADGGGGGTFPGELTAADLPKLPSDPSRLSRMFLNGPKLNGAVPQGLTPEQATAGKIHKVTVLMAGPLPPKVRAGLMRALAAQPGVHAIGRATDPLGRQGVALASGERAVTVTGESGTPRARQGTFHYRSVIIFDRRTGALLSLQDELTRPGGPYAGMKPGLVIHHLTDRSARWTGTKPSPPAELPFR
jgi:hypothetical protein